MQGAFTVLRDHQEEIHRQWFDRMLSAYPAESRRFLERSEKTFANPVGANLYESLGRLLTALLAESPREEAIREELSLIMRIKGVQEVLPSQACAFVPALKQIIGRIVAADLASGRLSHEALMDFYESVDTVALLAFDYYAESRDLIYELRLAQIKETNDILVKANLLNEPLDMSTFMQCASSVDGGGGCQSCPSANQPDIEKGV